ncbi:MAG: aldo/keto reductase [Bacteroidales bacterium]|nr:aldo/keto reductase [Bacteroidales bacterium]MBN2819157.1 aldo/keto reductase [Bacteroidales bacterium]
MERRDFIKTSVAAGALAISPLGLKAYKPSKTKHISDRVMLGSTGIEVSRLAIGTGTNGWAGKSNQTRELGIKGLAKLLNQAYEMGVFFWDSADQYGTHPHLKEALKTLDRDKVVILTKTHASTEEEMKADLDRFRNEIGTDYIDVMLLHCLMDGDWPDKKAGAMNILSKAREDGLIKAHGVSCHTLKALKTAANTDWVQVDMARINQAGLVMDATVPVVIDVLKEMKSKNKAIIGMKIFGAGKLSPKVDESLQHVLMQDYVDSFTIGIESLSQLKDLEKRLPEVSKNIYI